MRMLEMVRNQLATLRSERAALITEGDEIVSRSETPNDGDAPRATEIYERLGAINATEAELEAREAQLVESDRRAAAAATAPGLIVRQTEADVYNDVDFRSAHFAIAAGGREAREAVRGLRDAARRAITEDRDLSDSGKEQALETLRRHDTRTGALARHIIATGRPEYRDAFVKLVTQPHPLLSADEARAVEEVRSVIIGTDSLGGFLMPFTLDPTIILTNSGAINPLRQIATVRTVVTDNWQGVSTAGVTASWDAESAEVSDDTPTLAQPAIPVHKAAAFVPFSMEAEDDLAGLAEDVAMMFRDAKDRLEATAFTVGTGTGQPTGFVTSLVAAASLITSTSADVYAVGDVYRLQQALPARYRSGGRAAWVAALPIINATRQFATGTGPQHAFISTLADGQPEQMLGSRLYEVSDMDGVINAAAENYVLGYGDFSAYRIHDRIGLAIELVPHLFGVNRRPIGERGWYARWRVGANFVDTGAARLLNVT